MEEKKKPTRIVLKTPWRIFFNKTVDHYQNLNQFIASLHKVAVFDNLDDMYKSYVFLKRPSQLKVRDNYMLFRDNLIPAWENFPAGGCWIIKVTKGNELLDRLWEELVFASITEKFLDLDMVGIMVSIRGREDKISIWNRGNKVLNNGERLRKILNLDTNTHLDYQSFSHAQKVGATYRNAISFVYKPFYYRSNSPASFNKKSPKDDKERKVPAEDAKGEREKTASITLMPVSVVKDVKNDPIESVESLAESLEKVEIVQK